MEQIDKATIRNEAALAGLIFGLISGGYIVISGYLGNGMPQSLISFALWLAKLIGCIWLMCALMKRLCKKYDGVVNSDTMRFGVLAALLSALITAIVSYVATVYLFPDQIAEQMDQLMNTYSSILDSNSMSLMESMTDKMPVINLISNFIWCFLYGTILSAIASSKIPAKDPFAAYKKEQNEDEQ